MLVRDFMDLYTQEATLYTSGVNQIGTSFNKILINVYRTFGILTQHWPSQTFI